MPQFLCLYCYEKLENFHYFFNQVEKNQNALQTPQQIIVNVNTNDGSEVPDYIKIAISKNFNNFQNNVLYKIEDVEITVSNDNKDQLEQSLIVIQNENEQKYQQEHDNLIVIPNNDDEQKYNPSEQQLLDMHGYEIEIPPLVKITAPQKIKIEKPEQVQKFIEVKKEKKQKKNIKKPKKRNPLSDEEESDFESDCSSIFNDESGDDSDDFSGMGYNGDFSKFPDKIIQDTKLLIRGKKLMLLMSKFYRLDCDLCENNSKKPTFKLLSSLLLHYNTHHSVKGYVLCCDAKLVKARALAMHMCRHLQPEAFKCPKCDKMMTCPKILQYHIQNHLPEEERPLACPECPRRFSYSSALVAHAISHQPEEERIAHICDECGKTFSSSGRLSTHINVVHTKHDQVFVCHICARQFGCKGNLVYHLTTHQPNMHQVQCTVCKKWLKNKLCLRKHMVQHSLVRYACELCDYSALNRQCLRNHVRVQHSDVKPFNCEHCDKAFKLKNTLMNHLVQHTGIRKFSCQFCTRTFASSGNYYSHR